MSLLAAAAAFSSGASAADVSRDEDVARLFATIAATMPALAGIVHAARQDGG